MTTPVFLLTILCLVLSWVLVQVLAENQKLNKELKELKEN